MMENYGKRQHMTAVQRWISTMVVRLICNQNVMGSTPISSFEIPAYIFSPTYEAVNPQTASITQSGAVR